MLPVSHNAPRTRHCVLQGTIHQCSLPQKNNWAPSRSLARSRRVQDEAAILAAIWEIVWLSEIIHNTFSPHTHTHSGAKKPALRETCVERAGNKAQCPETHGGEFKTPRGLSIESKSTFEFLVWNPVKRSLWEEKCYSPATSSVFVPRLAEAIRPALACPPLGPHYSKSYTSKLCLQKALLCYAISCIFTNLIFF